MDDASPAFFRTSMDNLVTAARQADVGHFVVLSIVGVDQVPELDCYPAKTLQEDILKANPVPYSIVRATQFMEFIDAVLSWTADDDTVRRPRTRLQPVAAADVAATVAEVAVGAPLRGTLELAGLGGLPPRGRPRRVYRSAMDYFVRAAGPSQADRLRHDMARLHLGYLAEAAWAQQD